MKPLAVVLLSGGLDSSTTAAILKSKGWDVHALNIVYGQRHSQEIRAAERVAQELEIPLSQFSMPEFRSLVTQSALTNSDIELAKGRDPSEMTTGVPDSYVPYRNTVLLALAAAHLESLIMEQDVRTDVTSFAGIGIGANHLDYSGYPDCRPEYLESMDKTLQLGSFLKEDRGIAVKIVRPLLHKTKTEIAELAMLHDVPIESTWSCYESGDEPCRQCDSCILREKGLFEAGYYRQTGLKKRREELRAKQRELQSELLLIEEEQRSLARKLGATIKEDNA